ncbi:MAG: TetR/AcrR family transcriptional regulator [Pseudomonadota bacterium]
MSEPPGRRPKRRYHHGDLRTALLEAAETLIAEHGPSGFTLADASRLAGVSTAAPYRHFPHKDALLDAVRARGFERLTDRMHTAIAETGGRGSIEAMVAKGRAYVGFAIAEPAVLRLMFGSDRKALPRELSEAVGEACFGEVLIEAEAFSSAHGLTERPTLDLALQMWGIAHGVAALQIDGDFALVAPETDPLELVASITRAWAEGLIARGAGAGDDLAT